MFEITADDIARLDDEKLRAVVARLCEAELRSRGISPSCVTWGGSQNAGDGGIDVRVTLPAGSAIDGFVPMPATGFQVKKQDMPRAAILAEMRPGGVIRPSIKSLADQSAAYIIVSSQGSTADAALADRRAAMKEAMMGVPNADQIHMDFYDRTRLATWVRCHEPLIPWVRQQVGRPIHGWQSHGSWACAHEPLTAEYLIDDKLRIHPSKRNIATAVSALEGIHQIRDQLREPQGVVRLVGLSGVGKTRLVQALFDDRVGAQSLNPSLAIYANAADSPDPQPIALASQLAVAAAPSILVIDNCPPDLHQRLSEVCRQERSRLSLITVEYDIREDEPEGTEVFTLEASSAELIERLLQRRFPFISQVDARTIAGSSGGNARIGIALATTMESHETVAGLTDGQLFRRLFHQRHATPEESLYLVAQACSLVYSFEGDDVSGDSSELARIGSLVGLTAQEVYRHVAELKRRDLVQQRGVWRAVLPHAIANRLAAVGLENVPYAVIVEHLLSQPSGRLMQSFSRRLGYLHNSKEAREIAKSWLERGGYLEHVQNLNSLGKTMFSNVAPVVPEDVLSTLERACYQRPSVGEQFLDLLRSLAYEPALFVRCTTLMATILAARESQAWPNEPVVFTSLFQLYLSGSNANVEQRLTVVDSLLASSDPKQIALGVAGLKALLEATYFSGVGSFEFGAWPRDYGYSPHTTHDVQHWYSAVLKLVEASASGSGPAASGVRLALAEKFRGLWLRGGVCDDLVGLCRKIRSVGFWPEGWFAAREVLALDGKEMEAEWCAKLAMIEKDLRPADLCQRVRSIVLATRLPGIDLEDFEADAGEDISTRMARVEALAKNLGKAVAVEEAVLTSLLPELVSSQGRLVSFGEGLFEGTTNAGALWDRLVATFSATDPKLRNPQVICGFLRALHSEDPVLAAALLERCLEHESLCFWYPPLQVAIPLGDGDIARLKRSLAVGRTPVHMFRYLACGRVADKIPATDLRDLILTIAGIQAGYSVAIEILHMRLHSLEQCNEEIGQELRFAGLELLRQLRFAKMEDLEDYEIGQIARVSLIGEQGADLASAICRKLKVAVLNRETLARYHDDLDLSPILRHGFRLRKS